MKIIQTRRIKVMNTDPQRRCYNGCNYSEALVWSDWEDLESCPEDRIEDRLKFWKELNDCAVSQRGESAKAEFRINTLFNKYYSEHVANGCSPYEAALLAHDNVKSDRKSGRLA
jgi:hypothetical protein